MARDLIPWKHRKAQLTAAREEHNPFTDLQRRMNDLFDSFFSDTEGHFGLPHLSLVGPKGTVTPKIDISESETEVSVTADLPGMEEKDVSVTLEDNLLTIKGERKDEREEKKHNYHLVERSYGEFQRIIPLPDGIDQEKVKASFKNGVLNITLAKIPGTHVTAKKIAITTD